MKDKESKLEEIDSSHTPGGSGEDHVQNLEGEKEVVREHM
jgi:hypothetical protein